MAILDGGDGSDVYRQTEKEKARILKEALTIVEKLAGLDVDDKNDIDEIDDLIKKCIKIKKSPHFKLR